MNSFAKIFLLGIVLGSAHASATVIANNDIVWDFATGPDSIQFPATGGSPAAWIWEYGSAGNLIAFSIESMDTENYMHFDHNLTSGTLTKNPVTGDSATVLEVTSIYTGGAAYTSSLISSLTQFSVEADVLSFSFDYLFNGEKEKLTDKLSFGVILEIYSYIDDPQNLLEEFNGYAVEVLTNEESLFTNENGTISYSFGDANINKHWQINAYQITYAKDTVGTIPIPTTISLLLIGFAAFRSSQKI